MVLIQGIAGVYAGSSVNTRDKAGVGAGSSVNTRNKAGVCAGSGLHVRDKACVGTGSGYIIWYMLECRRVIIGITVAIDKLCILLLLGGSGCMLIVV